MAGKNYIAANIARLRLDRQLTQEELARKAGLSRMALGNIERGTVVPRARTLTALGKALRVPVSGLVMPVRPLETVRFRSQARVHARAQILAEVAKWLDAYIRVEADLNALCPFQFETVSTQSRSPIETAQAARKAIGFGREEPVRNICGLLENNGVKLLLLERKSDSFFGLSVGAGDGGPAVVVNTWDRISVERWIFTAAHELGHLLLHPGPIPARRYRTPRAGRARGRRLCEQPPDARSRFRARMGRNPRTPAPRPRPQSQTHLSGELQNRALPAGRIGS